MAGQEETMSSKKSVAKHCEWGGMAGPVAKVVVPYEEFVKRKKTLIRPMGIEIDRDNLNTRLFNWQADIVHWALRRGRAAIFASCGMGKSICQLEWAHHIWKHTQAPVVIHCPIGIRQQTKLEAAKFKVKAPIAIVDNQSDLIDGLNLINYEKAHKFDFSQCSGVVLDECFSPNTLIDVLENGMIIKKPIKEINVGQVILNSTGRDRVTKTHKRPITKAIRISIEGHWITSSEHHPYFTQRGWVQAADLMVGDYLVKTSTAMCLVSGRVQTYRLEVPFLRKILLSEMANEADRDFGQSTQSSSCKNTRIEEERLVQDTRSRKRDRAYSGVESYGRSQSTSKSESHTKGNETQTISSRREWDGIDSAPNNSIGSAAQRMDSRVCVLIGSSQEGLSLLLQNRLGKSQKEIGDRGGWLFTLREERSGPEKDEDAEFVRVDHTEILEQGHPELERWREADGVVYFYDLTAARHPSYSVAGCLVHNSSILKSLDGKTQILLTDIWAHAYYRLPCTATPAPNDHMELGNHAEFLGVCNSIDMLSKYFVHDSGDTSKWRLRKHAVKEFWRWVSSWAVCISKPSDIGGSDEGFDLPELKIHRHYVDVPDREPPKRTFFHTTSMSATNIHTERKMTNRSRCEQAVEIARKVKDYCIIWCDTNYEADLLKSLLPEAVEIRGQESDRAKEEKLSGFSNGDYKILISKPSIAGFGMNWQHCNQMVFAGLSFSFERLYQAIRRCYRFGQERPVHVHVILADTDTAVSSAIARKAADFDLMQAGMAEAMREGTMEEFGRDVLRTAYTKTGHIELPEWLQ